MRMNKKMCVIIAATTAAALTACAGAVVLFLKKKRHITAFMLAAVIMCGFFMTGGMTAYAYTDEDAETEYYYSTEPDEVITGDEVEIDIIDYIDPEQQPKQLTPPGNLTLVDDFSGEQANEKQFITVVTKNGNYFYIIIDRAGDNENVHFLNLVDEYDLLQILQGEEAETPPLPPGTVITMPEEPPDGETEEPGETPEAEPRENNMTVILIMVLVMAAIGGGAFYYYKVLKPKQGARKPAVKSELDEFDFDNDEDDLFTDGAELPEYEGAEFEDVSDTDNGDGDEDLPDFTLHDDPSTPDSLLYDYGDRFTSGFGGTGADTPESEGKE